MQWRESVCFCYKGSFRSSWGVVQVIKRPLCNVSGARGVDVVAKIFYLPVKALAGKPVCAAPGDLRTGSVAIVESDRKELRR